MLLIGHGDIALAAVTAPSPSSRAASCSAAAGSRPGSTRPTARALGARSGAPDALLLGLVALTVIAALSAVGALLATALIVVPAATVRLLTRKPAALAAGLDRARRGEGIAGLWLSVELNVPPGAAIAIVGGAVFVLAALARTLTSPTRAFGFAGVAVTRRRCSWPRPAAARSATTRTRSRRRRDDDADRRLGAPGRRAATRWCTRSSSPTPTRTSTSRGRATSSARQNADVVLENGDGLDHWMGKIV